MLVLQTGCPLSPISGLGKARIHLLKAPIPSYQSGRGKLRFVFGLREAWIQVADPMKSLIELVHPRSQKRDRGHPIEVHHQADTV